MSNVNPTECPYCGIVSKNVGLHTNHVKRFCKKRPSEEALATAEQKAPVVAALQPPSKAPVQKEPRQLPKDVQGVCDGLSNGLTIQGACDLKKVQSKPYFDLLRAQSMHERLTLEEEELLARIRQAEASFENDCLTDMSSDDRDTVNAAKTRFDTVKKGRFKDRNNIFLYSAMTLLKICKEHVSKEQYKAIIGDLSEIDESIMLTQLDKELGNFWEGN